MRRALALAAVLAGAAGIAFACYTVTTWKPAPQHVRYAWFCRVWFPQETVTGPACEQHPASYKPPWPYLGGNGRVIYPAPSASPARGG